MILDTKTILGTVTVILTFIGYIPYIRDIFRGKTKPHLYSWIIWGVLGLIIYIIQVQNNAGAGSWMTGLIGIISVSIAILSLKHGTKNITYSDRIILLASLIGISLWFTLKDGTFALVILCLIDVFAGLPTFRKSWKNPHEETLMLYVTASLRYGLSIVALTSYTMETTFYLGLWFAVNTLFCIFLVWRRKVINK